MSRRGCIVAFLVLDSLVAVGVVGYFVWRQKMETGPAPGRAQIGVTMNAPEPDRPLAELAAEADTQFPPPGPRIVIHKADHTLELFSGETLLKTYPCAFGRTQGGEPAFGLGPKRREGDRRTPEGEYFICRLDPNSPYHRFMAISYPSTHDADTPLAEGAITQAQRDGIKAAIEAGREPPQDTGLGSAIGIHGGGYSSEWTWGCIAVSDAAIEEIWDAAPIGTPVEIVP